MQTEYPKSSNSLSKINKLDLILLNSQPFTFFVLPLLDFVQATVAFPQHNSLKKENKLAGYTLDIIKNRSPDMAMSVLILIQDRGIAQ